MKKILTAFIAALCAMSVFAGDIIVTSDLKNGTYVEGTVQIGATTDINVYIVAENTIASALQSDIYLPDGLTAESGVSTIDGYSLVFTPHPELGNCVRLLWVNSSVGTINAQTPVLAAKVAIKAVNTLSAGNVEVKVNNLDFAQSYNNEVDDFISEISLQKAAVIEPQDSNYAFEIIPFVTEAGKTYTSAADNSIEIPVILNNADYVSEAKFNLTLPAGFGIASYKSGMKTTTKKPEVASSRSYNVSEGGSCDLVVNQSASGNVVTYTLTSTGDGDFVLSEGSGELCKIYLTTASSVEPGVYTLKIDNISITSTPDGEESTTHEGGEYLASVIVGQPADQEVILYGNYNEVTASAFTTALKNVAIAYTTGAKFADDAFIEDVILTNEQSRLSIYSRSSENFATTVLPYGLQSGPNCQLYTVKGMTSESITIEKVDEVVANTPCIFTGIITGYGEDGVPTLGTITNKSLGLTTFKGTYELTEIAAGAGYYISSKGKFYNDGATIRPFRAYFEGTVSGAKALQVLLEDETGIKDITDQFSTEEIYNLMGVKMNNAKKGVNIINGKKVYIK